MSIRDDYVENGFTIKQLVEKYQPVGGVRYINKMLRDAGILRKRGRFNKATITGESGRLCKVCKSWKNLTTEFHRDKTKSREHKYICKECVKNAKSKL
jgi:superfamily II helicase